MKRLCERSLRGIPLSPRSAVKPASPAPLMDISVWQVLIYLAPTVARSDEACRGGMLPRVQGEHYISHYLRTIGHFLLAAGQRG